MFLTYKEDTAGSIPDCSPRNTLRRHSNILHPAAAAAVTAAAAATAVAAAAAADC